MKAIILANGRPPKIEQVHKLNELGYTKLFCADGGADNALNLNLIPDYIIGDLDSISFKALDTFSNKSEVIKIGRQNDTDVEKCLKIAKDKGYRDIVLLAATGDRLDHSICNLGIVIKFFNDLSIKIVHETTFLTAYNGNTTFDTIPGETISLYGFNSELKISTQGLKYPITDGNLQFGINESTSNEAIGDKVYLEIENGVLFVVRAFGNFELL